MQAKNFGIFGILCTALFIGLLGVKAGWLAPSQWSNDAAVIVADPLTDGPPARDVWINIRQRDQKIGFGHEVLTRTEDGLDLRQRLQMRLKTLGLVQEIRMQTEARLNPDFTVKTFTFGLHSGSFHTRIEGTAVPEGLRLTTTSGGDTRQVLLPLQMPLYLPAGVAAALGTAQAEVGEERHYPFFDPATMGQATLIARYLGPEEITLSGQGVSAHHWRLSLKGASQSVWLGPDGEILKEEGVLGITLERTTRDEALLPSDSDPTEDLIQLAAIVPDRPITDAGTRRRLQVEVLGLPPDYPGLGGGRQYWDGRRLSIEREDAAGAAVVAESGPRPVDLSPETLIESDHPEIRKLAESLAAPGDPTRKKVQAIMGWMATHIERRPVVSVPSALATLVQGVGDCNEHAVLFAALARAMGIPTQVETGVTYLNGRFYYHAWNRVFLQRWVTVDALFQQFPADVTHIRLARGSTADQLNLLGVLGRLRVKVLETPT